MDLRKRPTVIVAAAEPLHRSGLASLVGETCAVLETVGTARAAAQAMSRLRPALTALVLDPPLPDAPAPQACASLIGAYPTTAALVLLREPDRVSVRLALRYGARGVLDTSVNAAQLGAALAQVACGEVVVPPLLARHLVGPEVDEDLSASGDLLTSGQLSALRLLARGHTSKQIASAFCTSAKAVDLTIERATHRLGANHRAQAVAVAMRLGLLA